MDNNIDLTLAPSVVIVSIPAAKLPQTAQVEQELDVPEECASFFGLSGRRVGH